MPDRHVHGLIWVILVLSVVNMTQLILSTVRWNVVPADVLVEVRSLRADIDSKVNGLSDVLDSTNKRQTSILSRLETLETRQRMFHESYMQEAEAK